MEGNNEIRSKAFIGIIWKLMERSCAQIVSLIVSIVLSRILMPNDYSIVSIVTIFFIFCNVFISGGFNAALIQKKDSDIIDYSSVLFISLIIACVLYIIMFLGAPFIAALYKKDILVSIIRIMALTFFINAFKGVLCAYISNNLQFRKFFFSTIGGTLFSALVGIIMALKGFGAWSLVAQQMTNSLIDTIILALTTRIRFVFVISLNRLKVLFNYGWKVFAASLISVIYDEVRPLIVGIKFSGDDLAYYNRGKSFPALINSSICDTISSVLFPVIAKFQYENNTVLNVTRRFIKLSSYLIFPMLIGFFVIADNFIKILLTEKWIFSVSYIRIFCISFMFNIIQTGNLQAIRAIGRSDILLILEIIKKILYFLIIVLFIMFTHSPKLLAISSIICSLVAVIINTYPNNLLFGYKYWYQIKDLIPNLIISIIMGIFVYLAGFIDTNLLLVINMQVFIGIGTYILLSIVTRNDNLKYIFMIIKDWKNK